MCKPEGRSFPPHQPNRTVFKRSNPKICFKPGRDLYSQGVYALVTSVLVGNALDPQLPPSPSSPTQSYYLWKMQSTSQCQTWKGLLFTRSKCPCYLCEGKTHKHDLNCPPLFFIHPIIERKFKRNIIYINIYKEKMPLLLLSRWETCDPKLLVSL